MVELLTERERKILNMIVKCADVKTAVYYLNYSEDPEIHDDITVKGVYAMFSRIRTKIKDSRRFVNTILNYRRRSELLNKRLTPKVRMKIEDEEEEEEEEEVK